MPPEPGNTHTYRFGETNSDVMEMVHLISKTSGYSRGVLIQTHIGCQVYQMLAEGTQSLPIRTSLSHLVSDEELVIDGEGHRVAGTEPPHRPVDGVSCRPPLFCILFYERDYEPLVLCYVSPSKVEHLWAKRRDEFRTCAFGYCSSWSWFF